MSKSADAFRTISEVAEWLGVQTHVLRFWESKFSQVRPVKRAGGRRYYRPNDMLLLGGIKQLLHEDGLTVKGVQKLLREKGVAHVADFSRSLDALTEAEMGDESTAQDTPAASPPPVETPVPDVSDEPPLPFDGLGSEVASTPAEDTVATPVSEEVLSPEHIDTAPASSVAEPESSAEPEAPAESSAQAMPSFLSGRRTEPPKDASETLASDAQPGEETTAPTEMADQEASAPSEPGVGDTFLEPDSAPSLAADAQPLPDSLEEPEAPALKKPDIVDALDPPALEEIATSHGILSRTATHGVLASEDHAALAPLISQLTALRDKMAASARNSG